MKRLLLLGIIGVLFYYWFSTVQEKKTLSQPTLPASIIGVTSSAFSQGQLIPKQYTCDGANINPPLALSGIPTNAKNVVIIMDDPDAPSGTWTHWVTWNISPDTKEIKSGIKPIGSIVGNNDFGESSYEGPCPPSGTHHYFFRIYALDIKVQLTPDFKRKNLEQEMSGHVVASGELMGKYSR